MIGIEAAVGVIGTLWAVLAGWSTTHLGRISKQLERIVIRLDDLEGDERHHRQAGLTYATAVYHALAEQDIKVPDPREYPGI